MRPRGHAAVAGEAHPVQRRDHLRHRGGGDASRAAPGPPGAWPSRHPGAVGAGVVVSGFPAGGRTGGSVGPPRKNCQPRRTATDRAIAISARFSILLSASIGPAAPRLPSAPAIAATSPANGTVSAPRRAMKQRRRPSGGSWARCRRYASRRRRRARFLTTLPPSRRPATKPAARGAGLPHPQEDEGGALDARPAVEQPVELRPGPEPLRPRQPRAGGRRPGHAASPSAGADPWRAGASAPSGRLSWPCAGGTRASWPAGAGSVGTSASPTSSSWMLCAQPAHPTDRA